MDKNTRKYNDLLKGIFWSEKVTTIWKSTKVVGRSQRYSEIQWNNNWIETKRSNQEEKKKAFLIDPLSSQTQPAFTCSKLTIETLKQSIIFVQS